MAGPRLISGEEKLRQKQNNNLIIFISVTVEFPLKNGADPCPYHVLPQYTVQIT
jgi:hypothetical protein